MPKLTLQEVLENLLPKAKVYEKSTKDRKPLVAQISRGAHEYIISRLEVCGNDFVIDDQKYYIQTSCFEVTNENTGEVFTRYSVWFNFPADTVVVADSIADTLSATDHEILQAA